MRNLFVAMGLFFMGCNFDNTAMPELSDAATALDPDAGSLPSEMDCAPGEIREEVCRTECGADNSYLVCRPTHVWECVVMNPALCEPDPDPVDEEPPPDHHDPLCEDRVIWHDADGDGYGNPTDYLIQSDCEDFLINYVAALDPDCDDGNPVAHPEGFEVCGNGVDEDCSGSDSACTTGDIPCVDEICGNGLDEDCDGVSDDGCSTGSPCERDARYLTPCIQPATSSRCSMAGVWGCVDGSLMCTLTMPVASTEVCGDSLDQDCNGSDLPCTSTCVPRAEICGNGIDEDCNGTDIACSTGCMSRTEICGNGLDEDCNGTDLACSTSGRRTIYEFYVPGDTWDPNSFRLRNGSWWGDENIIPCQNTGSQRMQPIGGGWYRCVAADRIDPFIGSYRRADATADFSTFDASRGICTVTAGVVWRVYDESSGTSLIPAAGLGCDTSSGAPRHDL